MGEDRHCWRAQVLPVGKKASKVCAEGCAGGQPTKAASESEDGEGSNGDGPGDCSERPTLPFKLNRKHSVA